MKKTLLFALLALSLNAFAQTNPAALLLREPRVNSLHKPGLQLNDFTHPSREVLDLIQRFDSIYMWGWDTAGAKLTLASKVTDITYNADNLPLSLTFYSRTGNSWTKYLQFVYTYDGNNNETSLLFKSWNGSSWDNYLQTFYTYDGNNNVITELSQYWIGISWLNISNYIYTYDNNHNVLTEISQSWDGAAWVNSSKTTNTYTNNNLTTALTQYWDDVNAVWVNQSQILNTFDGNHNELTTTYQSWNGISWDNTSLETYTYDGNHNQLTSLSQTWDGTGWVNISKTANTYNGSNNLTNSLTQNWNGASYDNAGRVTNTYNGSQLLIKSLSEIWDGTSWKYSTVAFYSYGENNFIAGEGTREYDGVTNTLTSGDSTHYYFKSVAGTKDLTSEDGTLTVYPNPSNGNFTLNSAISLGNVEVYNFLGERVYAAKAVSGQNTKEINLTGYSKGVYLIIVTDGTLKSTRKVMIQ